MSSACQGTSAITSAWGGLRLPSFRTSIGQTFETGSIPLVATTEMIINGADAALSAGLGISLNFPTIIHFLRLVFSDWVRSITPDSTSPTPTAKQVAQKEEVWKGKWVGTEMGILRGKEDSPGFHRGRSWSGAQVFGKQWQQQKS